MLVRLFVLILFVASPAWIWSKAYADKTVHCDAVDKKASVGVANAVAVSLTTGEKTCSFSISGASVDSRERPEFIEGLNDLLAGDLDSLSRSSQKLSSLRKLLFPGRSDDRNFIITYENAVSNYYSDFGACIKEFRSGVGNPFFSREIGFERNDASCRIAKDSSSSSGGPVRVDGTDDPVLIMRVSLRDYGGHFVLIPGELIKRGQRGGRVQ